MDPSADAAPGFIDIVRLGVESSGGSIALSMSMAAAVPAGSPAVGQLAYRFYLDLDGDGAWDRMAALEALAGGGFVPVLVDRHTGKRLQAQDFPGVVDLAGPVISLTVRLDALGCPSAVGVRGSAEQTRGGTTVRDEVPDSADVWTRVETDCPSG